MTFTYEHFKTQEEVREHIQDCEGKHTQQAKKCVECGLIFEKPYSLSKKNWSKQKLCSRKCRSKFLIKNYLINNKNHRWNGGRSITTQGYIEVISPDGFSRNIRGRILEHRLVM